MALSARDLIKSIADMLSEEEAKRWAAAMELADRDEILLRPEDLLSELDSLAEYYRMEMYRQREEVLTVDRLIKILQKVRHKHIPVRLGIEEVELSTKDCLVNREGSLDSEVFQILIPGELDS